MPTELANPPLQIGLLLPQAHVAQRAIPACPCWLQRRVLNLCLASLVLQEVSNFFTLYSYQFLGEPPSVLVRTVAWLPLALAALYLPALCQASPLSQGWRWISRLFYLVLAVGLALGVLHYQEFRFLAGDAARFMVPWLTLGLCLRAASSLAAHRGKGALLKYLDALAALAVLDAVAVVGFSFTGSGMHISNWLFLFGVAWAVFDNRHSGTLGSLVFVLCVAAAVLSAKRTNLGLLAVSLLSCAVFAPLYLHQAQARLLRLAGVCCTVLAAHALAQSSNLDLLETARSIGERTLRIVLDDEHDASYEYRLNEVDNVRDHFEQNPAWLLTGLGFGCEVPMLYGCDPGNSTASGEMHHVHKGLWVYLLRNGFLGLALLAAFAWATIVQPLRRLSGPYGNAAIISMVYCLGRFVAAFGGNLMLEDTDLPFVAALACAFAAPSPHAR